MVYRLSFFETYVIVVCVLGVEAFLCSCFGLCWDLMGEKFGFRMTFTESKSFTIFVELLLTKTTHNNCGIMGIKSFPSPKRATFHNLSKFGSAQTSLARHNEPSSFPFLLLQKLCLSLFS